MSRISQGSPQRLSPPRDIPFYLLPHEFMQQVNGRVPQSQQKPTNNPNSSAKKLGESRQLSDKRQPTGYESHTPPRPFSVTQNEVEREAQVQASAKKQSMQLHTLQVKLEFLERENANLIRQLRSKDDEIANCGKVDAENFNQKKQLQEQNTKVLTLLEDNQRLQDLGTSMEKKLSAQKEEHARQKKQLEGEIASLRKSLGQQRETQLGIRRTEVGFLEEELNKCKRLIAQQEKQLLDKEQQIQTKDNYQDGSLSLLLNKRNEEISQLTQKLKESRNKQGDLQRKVETLLDENGKLQQFANNALANLPKGDAQEQIKKLKKTHASELKNLEDSYKQKLQDQNKKSADVQQVKEQLIREKEQVRKLEQELKVARESQYQKSLLRSQLRDEKAVLESQLASLSKPQTGMAEIHRLNEKLSDNTHLMMQMEIRIKQINQEKEYVLQEQKLEHAQELKQLKDDCTQKLIDMQQKINRSEDGVNDKMTQKMVENQKLANQMKKLSNEISSQENKIRELLQEREDQYQLFQDQSVELLEAKQTIKLLKKKVERLEGLPLPSKQSSTTLPENNLKGSRSGLLKPPTEASDAKRPTGEAAVKNYRSQQPSEEKGIKHVRGQGSAYANRSNNQEN